ncbi:hypothetical protein HanIR_Chr16g0820441 [Helianthus annuus]|nr:hypothetical protein HanIR_Chr16g0820441 [Helianthus annuus]
MLTLTLTFETRDVTQDLLEASHLINGTKRALNHLRQNGFEKMMANVTSFCEKKTTLRC